MRRKCKLIPGLMLGALFASSVAFAADAETPADADTDRTESVAYVENSPITARIIAELALQPLSGLDHITVDTDKDGQVWLRGSAGTEATATQAVAIARKTEGVTSVHSEIKIQPEGELTD